MFIQAARLTFYAPGAHSLKDKRQIRKRIVDRVAHKFHVSIAEIADMDLHNKLVLGLAVISSSATWAERQMDTILRYIDTISDAERIETELSLFSD